jgi:glutathione S-transferase
METCRMKLYACPGTCSLAPHILLRETGLPFDLVRVDIGTHRTADGRDYYAINSRGQVPALQLDNGELLTEGPVIAQYIADQAGAHDLMPPPGTLERYRVMEWQNYISTELHKSFTPLFSADFDATAKAAHSRRLRRNFAWVDAQLANRSFLTGEKFTAADAYLYVVSGWAGAVKLDILDLKNLQGFLARVAARPAVRAAQQAERQEAA